MSCRTLNSLLSAAFLIPDSSSGLSGVRPMRSNLHTCRGERVRKSIDTNAVLSMSIWEPFVVPRKTIAPSVVQQCCRFHHANSPRGHHRLQVKSDRNSGSAGEKWHSVSAGDHPMLLTQDIWYYYNITYKLKQRFEATFGFWRLKYICIYILQVDGTLNRCIKMFLFHSLSGVKYNWRIE